jgi:hypothetical protein
MLRIYGLLNSPAADAGWPHTGFGAEPTRPADGSDLYPSGPPFGFLPVGATRLYNGDGGRSIFDGPTNGNWGGSKWSGGQYAPPGRPNGTLPPVDSGDELYMAHDLCWDRVGDDKQGKRACDRDLINGLDALPPSPKDWPRPPPPGTEGDTQWFRNGAKFWFGS